MGEGQTNSRNIIKKGSERRADTQPQSWIVCEMGGGKSLRKGNGRRTGTYPKPNEEREWEKGRHTAAVLDSGGDRGILNKSLRKGNG